MRSSRLLATLLLLQTRGRMTAEALADEFEVSVRRSRNRFACEIVDCRAETPGAHYRIGAIERLAQRLSDSVCVIADGRLAIDVDARIRES